MPPSYRSVLLAGTRVDAPPVVLLHGSNGDERDLLGTAREIAPGAARLSVRGDVRMDPGYAFLRRFPDRTLDLDDLRSRVPRLARFLALALGGRTPIVIGYSNGAIMATALLLHAPDAVAGAVLLRPLLPFDPAPGLDLAAMPVLVVEGAGDPRRAPDDGRRVSEALQRAGAVVERSTSASGHAVGPDDVAIARAWTGRVSPRA